MWENFAQWVISLAIYYLVRWPLGLIGLGWVVDWVYGVYTAINDNWFVQFTIDVLKWYAAIFGLNWFETTMNDFLSTSLEWVLI